MSKEKALKIVKRMEGTLIADLKSLEAISIERRLDDSLQEKLSGALNFTIFLMGLVACETLGYFISKKSEDGDTARNIKHFLSSRYFDSPELNKDHYLDALISLRTNLAHVYGMTNFRLNEIDKNLVLCVGDSLKPMIISNKEEVKLNGIKFIELIVNAFDSIKLEVSNGNNESEISRIISGKS